jgi:predicted nucleic acid-binding protein
MAQQPVFLVDTSVFVAHLRQTKAPTILEIARERYGVPVTSDIVIFELEVGAQH